MAYLLCKKNHQKCYLSAYHVVGRLENAVNTFVEHPEVSKVHFIIEWKSGDWYITDTSSNGTWLNNVKLKKHTATKIQLDDVINLASKSGNEYVVSNVSAPSNLLISPSSDKEIKLDLYNLLPDEQSPELSLFYNDVTDQWVAEYLAKTDQKIVIQHDDALRFKGLDWIMKVNSTIDHTVALRPIIFKISDLVFNFDVTADEESTQLILHTADQKIDFRKYNHHYLSLTLARKRIADMEQGLDESEQGWMYIDELSRQLGLAENHINIQVHRARKQFAENINSDLDQLFERGNGRIRFGSQFIKICKAGTTEYAHERITASELNS